MDSFVYIVSWSYINNDDERECVDHYEERSEPLRTKNDIDELRYRIAMENDMLPSMITFIAFSLLWPQLTVISSSCPRCGEG